MLKRVAWESLVRRSSKGVMPLIALAILVFGLRLGHASGPAAQAQPLHAESAHGDPPPIVDVPAETGHPAQEGAAVEGGHASSPPTEAIPAGAHGEAGAHGAGGPAAHEAAGHGEHAGVAGHGEHGGGAGHGHQHEAHHRFHIGVTGALWWAFEHEGPKMLGGGGAFFEVTVIQNWLELELAVKAMVAPGGVVELPIDLLIKKPFHVNRWFHPFIGLGPTIVPVFELDRTALHYGGASAIGAHFWVTGRLALLVEANYNLVYAPAAVSDGGAESIQSKMEEPVMREGELLHEVGASVGLVVGW